MESLQQKIQGGLFSPKLPGKNPGQVFFTEFQYFEIKVALKSFRHNLYLNVYIYILDKIINKYNKYFYNNRLSVKKIVVNYL